VGRVLLATLLLFACPPTATPDKPARATAEDTILGLSTPQSGWFRSPYGNPYGDHFYDFDAGTPFEWASLPVLEHDLPELPTLPLWDLDATLAQIEAEHGTRGGPEWLVWLRWVILSAQGRPATAHGLLTSALSSDQLTAERLMWWRSLSPYDLHARDALLDAALGSSVQTHMYLAAALALGEWALSCPVAVAIDGVCRMPGGEFLVRREPIGVARAREWTKVANKLRRKLSIDPTDIAALALFAELELAAMTEDYESQLVARMPDDLDFLVEDYMKDSGVPKWERRYERQRAYANESRARFNAFYESSQACARSIYDRHVSLVRVHADLAARIHLREAMVLLTEIEDWTSDTSSERERWRNWSEGKPLWFYQHGDDSMDLNRARADDLLTRCIDPTFTPDLEVIEACRNLLDDLDATPTQAELVPQPQSRSTMQRQGLVTPLEL
jgi:hypothetical protein